MKQYTVKVYDDKTEWYNSDNKLDRDDGPAIEWHDGSKRYCLDGIKYSKKEYYNKINSK